MDDKTLLERAARSYWAGEIDDVMSFYWSEQEDTIVYIHADNQDHNGNDVELLWLPHTEEHDCMRLAAKLQINIDFQDSSAWHRFADGRLIQEHWGGDFDPCYKKAVVRAAAAIGSAHEAQ